jgi:hypothetical protein
VFLYHILRERNQYAEFFANLEASSDVGFLTYDSPPADVYDLLKNDAIATFFLHD